MKKSQISFNYRKNWQPKNLLESLILINKEKSQHSIAIDVGCAVGIFPIKFCKEFKEIYCFDASFNNIKICNNNLESNKITNVYCHNFAASNDSGKICKIINNKNAPYNNICLTENIAMKVKHFIKRVA